MAKISLNSHVNSLSGGSWTLQTINSIKYFVSQNKTSSSVSSIKCSFTTPYDNINVVVEIGSSSENNYDWCYIGKLDDSSAAYDNYLDRISGIINNGPKFKTVTINVPKAGTHFLIIGYRKDGSGNVGNDCGYFRLITTEVESQKHSYIYCGTKTTVVSEKPIVFSKDGTTNDKFVEYNDPNNMFQWKTDYVDGNYYSTKVSFKTTSDNTEITLIYKYHFNNYKSDKFYVSFVDTELRFNSNDYIYQTGHNLSTGTVTKKISIQKAGDHYINIGFYFYRESYVKSYVYVGFSGTNVITDTKILTPGNILANNKDISEVYVGSELIWRKPIIMWFQNKSQEMTFVNNSDGNVLNGKVTIPTNTYDKFSYGNNVISGSNDYNSQAYYGLNVKDIINNGYIYLVNYQRAMDLSVFPNPLNMEYRHGWSNRVGTCMFLKINPKLEKETTSLSNMFMAFNKENYNSGFTEPLIVNHKACNIVGLDKLNTSNITNMNNMFYYSRIVGNIDFSNWDTSKVTNMSYMFCNMKGLNRNKYNNKYLLENYSYLTGLNNWNLQSVNDMRYIFNSSTYYDFQDKELAWDTSNVTDMSYMFAYCNAYNFPKLSFDTRNVTNMSYMFTGFESYNDLKLNFTDTSKVTDMSYMFAYYNTFKSDGNDYDFSYLNYHGNADISCLDTSNVVNAENMFYGCKYITPDMIKNIRLPKATNIKNMFKFAYMGGWDFVNKKTTYIDTIDLSSFDLSYIDNFSRMKHAFAFGGYKEYNNDAESINTYINNLILDNWKCFKDYGGDLSIYLANSPFYGCKVTYCYMRGCNNNTKRNIKKMLGFNGSNTNSSCKYFIEY